MQNAEKKTMFINASTLSRGFKMPFAASFTPQWVGNIGASLFAFSRLYSLTWQKEIGYFPNYLQEPLSDFIALCHLPFTAWHYQSSGIKNTIERYKMGEMTTDEFLNKLKKVIPATLSLTFSDKQREEIFQKQQSFLCITNKHFTSAKHITDADMIKVLLEQAWALPRIKSFDTRHEARLNVFGAHSSFALAILISNTNPLDMFWLQKWMHLVDNSNVPYPDGQTKKIAEISKLTILRDSKPQTTLLLATSYNAKLSKTNGMIQQLIGYFPEGEKHIVSQWKGDLNEAKGQAKAYSDLSFFNDKLREEPINKYAPFIALLMIGLTCYVSGSNSYASISLMVTSMALASKAMRKALRPDELDNPVAREHIATMGYCR